MNQIKKIVLLIVLISFNSFAQPNKDYVKHTVLAGETVTQIAKKYKITPYDIYTLNPEAKNGINENQILLISLRDYKVDNKDSKKDKKLKEDSNKIETYIVQPKDTKYNLAKKFNITIDDLDNWNKVVVRDGLQEGQVLIVKQPINPDFVISTTVKDSILDSGKYIIQPEDTKYGIAKKFELTIEELEELNPEIADGFPVGIAIAVTKKGKRTISKEKSDYEQYEIKPKETLYGISKKFNVSQMEILKLNPILSEGFKEGLVINIPSDNLKELDLASDKTRLVAKKSDVEKTLVLLLPFNIPMIENDSIRSKSEFLNSKHGQLTNIALDYYAGALIAIDSARRMGYSNLKVKVIDFESKKTSNNLNSIIQKNDFSKVNAVVGPLINSQVEQTAIALERYNIPIISPLSVTNGKPYPNIYYARPSDELMREMLFNHFKKNNGNVLAIFSNKKQENKETVLAQFPELKIVPLTEKGAVTSENIISLLDPTKKNFVILDTEKTNIILNTTSILSKLKSKYDIQLVVFEIYDALEFEEIPLKRYTDLKMMFPSVTRTNKTGYYESFQQKFKKENNVNPNFFATRGFDVTFDTILRIYQENGFVNSTTGLTSEQLQSKFNYRKIEDGNYNTGIYLMHYTDELTIEEVK
ncbi:LysM peptidoglycan-binding domain-containing protein [uncultured Flavobacterium sp.]|uniref:amino acid ABC transporter substrate-binding protein n=1 Tax=uncultured Flavobacterium sp. TaxID=165435 RepID=UPI0030EF9539|tara:strand:- start:198809 stop:200737 length:1929 start_codon:yes stop_codon:yes gene_type:complete